MVKLDKKDRDILHQLDCNARQTNSEISKKGVIIGSYPVVDFLKLGYSYNRAFIRLQFLDDELRKRIEDYVKQDEGINWAVWFRGDYDLGLAFWTRTATQFKERLLRLVTMFNDRINKVHPSQVVRLDHFSYRAFHDKEVMIASIREVLDVQDVDDLDKGILLELNKDARLNSTQIAKDIGSNYKVVSYRIKRLNERGILLTSRAKIDHLQLGLIQFKVFIHHTFKDVRQVEQLREFLTRIKQTIYLVDHTESNFLDVELIVGSVEEFEEILRSISNTFGGFIKEFQHFTFGKTI